MSNNSLSHHQPNCQIYILHSFAVPNLVSWRRLMIFSSLLPLLWCGAYGEKERDQSRLQQPDTHGRTSVRWRRAATQRERERERWVMEMGGWVRLMERAFFMGAERASGPAQGSAPPADKRSILSISLSALDNKQKFNRPSSCLACEMFGSHMRLHSDPSGTITGSHLNMEPGPQSQCFLVRGVFLIWKSGF